MSEINSFSDYAIKNGSYGKLLKAYYAKQDAEKASSGGDTVQRSTLMKSGADALKKLTDALNRLSEYNRNVSLMYFFLEEDCEEIAEYMGKCRSTISFQRKKSLQKLRQYMEQ